MGKVVNNREGARKVVFDISGDTNFIRVSKRRKEAFPHIVVGSTGNSGTEWVRIGVGCGNSTDPWFLDKNDVSHRGLKERMSQRTLSVHVD